ncbi:MAG: hypothetical protein ORN50_07715 [Crocinitomicaceae bacterium]|nr:hypothetical protein [Crocinitomicaceae bacterium]
MQKLVGLHDIRVLNSRGSKANNAFIESAEKTTEKYNNIIGKPLTNATSDLGQKAARTG